MGAVAKVAQARCIDGQAALLRYEPMHVLAYPRGRHDSFWRVEAIEASRLLRLRAEMKVPGRAWLQFERAPGGKAETLLTQTAFFEPKGLVGLLYWYLFYLPHLFIFPGMLRAIKRHAEAREARPSAQVAV